MSTDDHDASAQVAALHQQNKFLYAQGDSGPMEWYLRSNCIVKGGPFALCVVLFGPAVIDGHDKQKSTNVQAVLFNLWFLLIDGRTFYAKSIERDCSRFYQEWMKLLVTMLTELPGVYNSYRKFIDDNIFGKGEEETVNLSEEEQVEFTEKFHTDIQEEKAQQKAKDNAEQGSTTDSAKSPAGGSGEEQD
ncbi:hypothetical protein BDM02DRAFT_3132039 [Thelephora ganbajun]|uniref:Uncharacterized protein n=1 Tax=Thelephora ganbajun TaxID=370292 RepID=A0ACB6Z3A0_THEGA|nr:hypothetical protein BDM02DRAFT_3132039 [Thelephora ganbajun]